MCDIKWPCRGKASPLPEISQPRPSPANVNIAELQAPKQRRGIGKFRHRTRRRDLRVVDGKRGRRILGIEVKQRSMPGQMDGKARIDPRGFVRGKKFEPLSTASLHLHDMRDDMHGRGMTRVDFQCPPRHFFSAAILAVLLEAESIHRKNAGIAGRRGIPFRQHLSNAISQHVPQTQTEVERVRNSERENVARKVDNDRPVAFDRKGVIAVKPGTRRQGVTTCLSVGFPADRLDCGYTLRKPGQVRSIVATHDESHPKTMSEDRFWMIGKRQINVM